MATLTVIVGYCGSGKTWRLENLQAERPDAGFMDEGFLSPSNDRDRARKADILEALAAGRDCYVTLMDCACAANRALLIRQRDRTFPGTQIAWIFYENDVAKANQNCLRDPERKDPEGNVDQNNRCSPGYSVPDGAQVLPMHELPMRAVPSPEVQISDFSRLSSPAVVRSPPRPVQAMGFYETVLPPLPQVPKGVMQNAAGIASNAWVDENGIPWTDENGNVWTHDLPEVTVKALLQFADQTKEGLLVAAVAVPWFEIIATLQSGAAHEIGARTWEEIIAGAYDRAGFDEVILTPRSGDKGRDVIATKNGVGSIRIFDQVKAYKPGHVVTADDVRAMLGVITGARNVSKGVITTTSTFAPRICDDEYIAPFIPHRLELRPRAVLLPWLEELAKDASAKTGSNR